MMQKIDLFIVILFLALASCQNQDEEISFLVSPEWLYQHLHDDNLVLLQVDSEALYDSLHIPSAQYANYRSFRSPKQPDGLRTQLPDSARLDSVFQAHGIDRQTTVVVYFGKNWVTPAARICFTLKYGGLEDVHLLDGGMPAWQNAGYEVTDQKSTARYKSASVKLHPEMVADLNQVKEAVDDPGYFIIDARDADFYDGSNDGHGHILRPGHIKGAVSIPYQTLLDTATLKLKPITDLAEQFKQAGYKQGQMVITYCHVGQQACLPYWAAVMLEYPARLYDGSYDEWERDAALPIDTGK